MSCLNVQSTWFTGGCFCASVSLQMVIFTLIVSVLAQERHDYGARRRGGGYDAHAHAPHDMKPPFKQPVLFGNMVLFGNHAYRAMDETTGIHPTGGQYGVSCQSRYWHTLPMGWEVAPDTEDVRSNVVAPHTWGTQLMVLFNENGLDSSYPAYRTAGYPPAGARFGDTQAKARKRVVPTGNVTQYRCPWTCYQILIRRAIRGRHENDSKEPTNGWVFDDDYD